MDRVNWQRVRDILICVICIGIVLWASISILGLFVHAIVLLLLSMAVAYLVTPLVNLISRYKHVPRWVATLLVYIFVLGGIGALCYGLVFSLIQQVDYFSAHLPVYVQNLPQTYSAFQKWLVHQGIPQTSINKAITTIEDQANAFAVSLASNLVSIILIVSDVVINILLVAVLGFYLTLDGKRIRDGLVGIAPKRSLPHVLLFEDALNRVVGNYIRGQLALAAIIGILAGVGSYFLGLSNFALIIGALAFLFETIPMLGPALASIPAVLISLLLPDPFPRTYAIMIYFAVIQLFESNILGPRIVGHAVGLHPVASILALVVGVQLFGAFGALLATPILAASWVVITSLYRSLRGQSIDDIVIKKPTSWIRRHPRQNPFRMRKGHSVDTNANNEDKTGDTLSSPGDMMHRQGNGISTPGKIEHLDLLRPAPQQEQATPVPTGPLSESSDQE